jgi:FtsZ-interacting cell division protein YlmF
MIKKFFRSFNRNVNLGQKFSIEMVKPKNLKDAEYIINSLLGGVPVIVNLEETAEDRTKQIIDFIRGEAIAVGCQNEQIGNEIFIFTPKNVELEFIE